MRNKRGRGRPTSHTGTREAILAAATRAFGELGFDGASIRAIAAEANVDPALARHYFHSKRGLFVEAVALPIGPEALLERVFHDGPENAGARLVATFLEAWQPSSAQPVMIALMRSAVSDNVSAAALRERLTRDVLTPIVRGLGSDAAEWRTSLAASHLAGLAAARYILCVEPLASAPAAAVIAAVGPVIQHYLTGEIEGIKEARNG